MSEIEINFKKPPVVEVACGVFFARTNPSKLLKSAHIGLFWQLIREQFPNLEEAPLLPAIIEPKSAQEATQFNFEITPIPQPRYVLSTKEGNTILQIQSDRFILNWRRIQPNDVYPRYKKVFAEFNSLFLKFQAFLKENDFGTLIYRQFDLVYVNLIGSDNGLDKLGFGGLFVDHIRNESSKRFLEPPLSYNWLTTYVLPKNWGRLHVNAMAGWFTAPMNRNAVRLEITARGIPDQITEEARLEWFKIAHNSIVKGFEDTTVERLQTEDWEKY